MYVALLLAGRRGHPAGARCSRREGMDDARAANGVHLLLLPPLEKRQSPTPLEEVVGLGRYRDASSSYGMSPKP